MVNKLRIGPSGNSVTFYKQGYTHTYEAFEWLNGLGLNAYEYSFGRGITLKPETAMKIKSEAAKYDVAVSVHAPYYINFANEDPEMIEKSFGYILKSVSYGKMMGATRVIFHPATCGKMDRESALSLTKANLIRLVELLKGYDDAKDFKICPETMGKNQQIGRVEEVVDFCKLSDQFYPCYDFGHINSYTQGGLKSYDDYKKIIDYTIKELGEEKSKNLHIHFSKIEYSKGGEVKHLDFTDKIFGPLYQPLAQLIDDYALTPVIICESKDVMSDDALIMKNMHKNI